MKYDVAVVGGGPSGAVCARELALLGYTVILLERACMPRNKVCGEYLNCGTLRQLEELHLLTDVLHEAYALQGLRIHTAGKTLHLSFPYPAMSVLRRSLDTILLDAARKAGVQIVHGRVSSVCFRDDEVCGVSFESEDETRTVEARYTIGADGCGSIIARKLLLTKPLPQKVRYAMGGHFQSATGNVLEMYVEKGTYLAANPVSDTCANVMLIAPKSLIHASSGHSQAWFSQTARVMMPNRLFDLEQRIGSPVAFGPLAHAVSTAAAHNVLLVGDAAGFISPFTGQGVCIALSSARAAAAAVHAMLSKKSSEKQEKFHYSLLQRRERNARSRLSSLLDILAYAPFLAHRVIHRIEQNDRIRGELLNLFCGLAPPSFVRGARLLFETAI